MTFSEFLQKPFEVVFHQSKMIPYYVASEMGWITIPFACLGIYYLWKKNTTLTLYLVSWIVLPYIVISFMTKVLFPRYIIFFGSLLTILASYYIGQVKNKKILYGSLALILGITSIYNLSIWFDYTKIPFPQTDRGQYIQGATVGLGAKEIIEYVRNVSRNEKVLVLAEGDFGMSGDILDTFLKPTDTISIKAYWPLSEKELIANQNELKDKRIFVVTAHHTTIPGNWPVVPIKSYYKYQSPSVIHFLELVK